MDGNEGSRKKRVIRKKLYEKSFTPLEVAQCSVDLHMEQVYIAGVSVVHDLDVCECLLRLSVT